MIPKLIGLYSSHPQSGKTSVAGVLQRHGYLPLPFADCIKKMLRVFLMNYGFSASEIEYFLNAGKGNLIPRVNVSARHLMRTLGTEWGRDCVAENVWSHSWLHRASDKLAHDIPVVVDDVRFKNEADLIKNLNGQIWKISRTDTIIGTPHPSEGGLDNYPQYFDRTFTNNAGLSDLESKIELLFSLSSSYSNV